MYALQVAAETQPRAFRRIPTSSSESNASGSQYHVAPLLTGGGLVELWSDLFFLFIAAVNSAERTFAVLNVILTSNY